MTITYSKYTRSKAITLSGLGYYFSTPNIVAMRGDKWLKFDDVHSLYLSLDGGRTYGITLNLNGVLTKIKFAYIFTNGTILFGDHTKMYYSTDSLSTYHESTVKGIDGNSYTPSTYNNFYAYSEPNEIFIGGQSILVWGCYSTDAGTVNTNINCWYTIDHGVNIKSCFKAGVSLAGQTFKHIHAVSYNVTDNSFWLQTGDGDSGVSDCYWFKGLYDWSEDTWSWTQIRVGNQGQASKTTEMIFYNGNVYYSGDSNYGIWTVAYTNVLDAAHDTRLLNKGYFNTHIKGNSDGSLMLTSVQDQFYISRDYWATNAQYAVPEATIVSNVYGYISPTEPNADGYRRYNIAGNTKTLTELNGGKVLMLRVK